MKWLILFYLPQNLLIMVPLPPQPHSAQNKSRKKAETTELGNRNTNRFFPDN